MDEITREELLELICLTSATDDCLRGDRSSSCNKCDIVLNCLLDRYDTWVRNKIIDELVKSLKGDK